MFPCCVTLRKQVAVGFKSTLADFNVQLQNSQAKMCNLSYLRRVTIPLSTSLNFKPVFKPNLPPLNLKFLVVVLFGSNFQNFQSHILNY